MSRNSTIQRDVTVPFRGDTSHIFRDAPGHLREDTPSIRAVIRGVVRPENLRDTKTLREGGTLERCKEVLRMERNGGRRFGMAKSPMEE